MAFSFSYVRNWHKPGKHRRAKQVTCTGVVPFLRPNGDIELKVTRSPDNRAEEQLYVVLTGEEAKLFLMNMDRFIYKKENVKRTDYGLPSYE